MLIVMLFSLQWTHRFHSQLMTMLSLVGSKPPAHAHVPAPFPVVCV